MSKEGNVNGVGSPQENSSSNLDDYTMADFKTSFKIVSSERDQFVLFKFLFQGYISFMISGVLSSQAAAMAAALKVDR